MPNIVNIIQTDTFEAWRVKNNELGTVLGDLTLINSNNKSGEDTVIVTLNNLRYETTNNAGWVGDISTLFSAPNYSTTDGTLDGTTTSYGNLTDAANRLKADADTRQAEIGNIFTLTHYSTLPTLVGTLNSHDARLDVNEHDRGTMANLDPLLLNDILVPGSGQVDNLVSAINANTDYIQQIATASGIGLTTVFGDIYDGTQTSVSGALNNDYARLNTLSNLIGGTQSNGSTSASAVQTALYGTHTNLVSAINGIEDFVLTNSKWDGTDNKSLIWALNNHESRLDTEENNVDLLQGDVGAWSNYEGMMAGNGWTQGNITDAIINIRTRQDNLTGDFVNASGDTMTGNLTFTSGGVQATGQYLNLGVGGTSTVRINTSNRVGIGKAAHASYKVDVSGTLNATDLKIGGQSLDDRFIQNSSGGGTATISANILHTGTTTFTGDVVIGTETIFNSSNTFTETVQDISGNMFAGNSTSGGINTSYNDSTGKVTLSISDDGHNHVVGNIDGFTENVQDIIGSMVSSNTESGIQVTYNDAGGKLDFNVYDPLIKLVGDVTGQATMSNLGDVTITTAVGNDNHNHDGRYYTETEANAKFLLNTTDTLSGNLTITGNTTSVVHHATDYMQVGSNGSSTSFIDFYDDNSNTWRTLKWDDAANEWQMEDQGGSMRRVYHSGNALKVLNSGGTQLFP